jgi:hypothetical protein
VLNGTQWGRGVSQLFSYSDLISDEALPDSLLVRLGYVKSRGVFICPEDEEDNRTVMRAWYEFQGGDPAIGGVSYSFNDDFCGTAHGVYGLDMMEDTNDPSQRELPWWWQSIIGWGRCWPMTKAKPATEMVLIADSYGVHSMSGMWPGLMQQDWDESDSVDDRRVINVTGKHKNRKQVVVCYVDGHATVEPVMGVWAEPTVIGELGDGRLFSAGGNMPERASMPMGP